MPYATYTTTDSGDPTPFRAATTFRIERGAVGPVALAALLIFIAGAAHAAPRVDFNRDGKADVFWYNVNTGSTSAWLMAGDRVARFATYGNVPLSSGWSLRGYGDF